MIIFDTKQIISYLKNSSIEGTGYLAFRDIPLLSILYRIDLSNVLDLGCGGGRSTQFLQSFCNIVSGTDISKNMLNEAKNRLNANFFLNELNLKHYEGRTYSAIFSILMFFHLSTFQEVENELIRCFNSLDDTGHLIIVSGTRHLYIRNFSTIKGYGPVPNKSGDRSKVYLSLIDTYVEDCYWAESDLISLADKCGFDLRGLHYPIGQSQDKQNYLDECIYPPYFNLIFQRKS